MHGSNRNQQSTSDSPATQGADIYCWLAALCGRCTICFALAVQSLCFDRRCWWTVCSCVPVLQHNVEDSPVCLLVQLWAHAPLPEMLTATCLAQAAK
jgi:hypothetical protein